MEWKKGKKWKEMEWKEGNGGGAGVDSGDCHGDRGIASLVEDVRAWSGGMTSSTVASSE